MGTKEYQGTEKMQLDKNTVLEIVFKAMENGGFGRYEKSKVGKWVYSF